MNADTAHITGKLRCNNKSVIPGLPLVCIVILNWNGWKETATCLDSLNDLSYQNYQIILVDNGSTDDSVIRIRSLYNSISIIEVGYNLGFSGGCNVGINHAIKAGADYVWLLNNDTVVERESLSALVDSAKYNNRIGAVGSIIYEINPPTDIQAWGGGWVDMDRGKSYHSKGPKDSLTYITGASLLLSVEALNQIGLFDEKFFLYWEDTDLSYRLRANGWNLLVAPSSRIWHVECSSTGRFSQSRARLFYRSRIYFFKKYSSRPLFAILQGLLDQSMRDIIRMRWGHLIGAWQGTLQGLKDSTIDEP